MNTYIRFFDQETIVKTADEALDFLYSLDQFNIDDFIVREVTSYIEGNMTFPKRVKLPPRLYFIMIKTNAETMEEFKSYSATEKVDTATEKENLLNMLNEENIGWYQATIIFKRVISNPETGKHQYVDTEFEAKVFAKSIQDLYNQLVLHLQGRNDIDPRSQYPSIKGQNFKYQFLGA